MSLIGYAFWRQEIKYLLPTPIPQDYTFINIHSLIDFDEIEKEENERPSLLHFFNPNCPCSKFNLNHFNELYDNYHDSIDFYVVVPEIYDTKDVSFSFPKSIKILVDKNKSLAKKCGVYSTPQAAIITKENRLFFRGNYNKSRYCTNPVSNYVAMALDSLVLAKNPPQFEGSATISYGCELPN